MPDIPDRYDPSLLRPEWTEVGHVCHPPEAEAWWTRSQDAEDWHAEFWRCHCGQWWTVDRPACHECGRSYPAVVTKTHDPDDPKPAGQHPWLPFLQVARDGFTYGQAN